MAQNSLGEFVINGGVGFSLMPTFVDITSASNFGSNSNNNNNQFALTYSTSSIPAINASADCGLTKELSLGLGLTYQSCTVHVNDWFNYQNGTNENVTENISRLNIRIRAMGHWDFADDHNWELYGGVCVGESFCTDLNNSLDPTFPNNNGLFPYKGASATFFSFQVLAGLRGYFTPGIGLHLEAAAGTPYFLDIGMSFRLGGEPLSKRDN